MQLIAVQNKRMLNRWGDMIEQGREFPIVFVENAYRITWSCDTLFFESLEEIASSGFDLSDNTSSPLSVLSKAHPCDVTESARWGHIKSLDGLPLAFESGCQYLGGCATGADKNFVDSIAILLSDGRDSGIRIDIAPFQVRGFASTGPEGGFQGGDGIVRTW